MLLIDICLLMRVWLNLFLDRLKLHLAGRHHHHHHAHHRQEPGDDQTATTLTGNIFTVATSTSHLFACLADINLEASYNPYMHPHSSFPTSENAFNSSIFSCIVSGEYSACQAIRQGRIVLARYALDTFSQSQPNTSTFLTSVFHLFFFLFRVIGGRQRSRCSLRCKICAFSCS